MARPQPDDVFERAFDQSATGMALLDTDGRRLRANRAWEAIMGDLPHVAVIDAVADLVADGRLADGEWIDRRPDRTDPSTTRSEAALRRQFTSTGGDGSEQWIDLTMAALCDDGGQLVYVSAQVIDITDAKQLELDILCREQDLFHRATHDALTGLANRAMIDEHLHVAVDRATRHDQQQSIVMFIDLDHFKTVNDTCGHLVGDRVLVEVAARLSATCRASDIVGRYGGDEFVAIVSPVSVEDDGTELASRLLESIAAPIETSLEPLEITASVGVAVAIAGDSVTSVLSRADRAAYEAKHRGGNRTVTAAMALPSGSDGDRGLTTVDSWS